jgi:hypothetical protein
MDSLGIGICLALVGAICLTLVYAMKRTAIKSQLARLENPPTIKSTLRVGDALKRVRGVLKNTTFASKKWTIKEDNPNGMLIAVLTFEEDLGNHVAVAKRQLVLTVSVAASEISSPSNLSQDTEIKLMYSVFATFGRQSCDQILRETSEKIESVVRQQ